ncbi:MAG: hypothetical protein LBU42_09705 [Prevotellaceae bacterium]|jgi:hypothetical protein|nr:hypothetical protein [Prevotellaceae bacterium]
MLFISPQKYYKKYNTANGYPVPGNQYSMLANGYCSLLLRLVCEKIATFDNFLQ